MKTHQKLIIEHYRQANLEETITAAYERAGMNQISHDDTAPLDEFHIRGRAATRELAELAGLKPGMKVLDLGCGVGGPARTLAAEYGCNVTGVDIIEEYIHTAKMLTDRVGVNDKTTFLHRDMMEYPFENETFDAVWTLHTTMNIENKAELFKNIRRALKPEGIFILYEICSGSVSPPVYPVPWASDASINFIVDGEELQKLLKNAGLEKVYWQDVTESSLQWYKKLVSQPKKKTGHKRKPGINLVMGDTARDKMKNVVLNMKENRIRVIQGVVRKKS
ncbi:methyltransferase domain-containing protein [Desulfobacterales bacterium HSG16]|nr:methyltransferase domain-containing protein [Desulfobacterales bacterium HSG16]